MKNYVTTLGIALTLASPHAAQTQSVTPPPVPTKLQVAAPTECLVRVRRQHASRLFKSQYWLAAGG